MEASGISKEQGTHEDLLMPLDELQKIVEELKQKRKCSENTGQKVKHLQLVVARIFDELQRQKKATKSVIQQSNAVTGSVMELASRRDMCREERIWDPSLDLPSPSFNYLGRLYKMLEIHGQVKRPEMHMLLGIWGAKRGREGSQEVLLNKAFKFLRELLRRLGHGGVAGSAEEGSELVATARQFLDRPWQELPRLTTTQAYDAVLDGIPEEDWLTFARDGLGMTETEINEIKRHCTPTREQLHQLNLQADNWNQEHGLDG